MDTSRCNSQRFEANQCTHQTHTHPRLFFRGSCDQSVTMTACDGRLILSLPCKFFFRLSVYPFSFSGRLALCLCLSINFCFLAHCFFFFYCKFCLSLPPPPVGILPQDVCYFLCLTLFIVCVLFVCLAQYNQNVSSPRTR